MILVTGGTGLVGSHLLVKLLKSQQKVRALYRSPEKIEKCKAVFQAYEESDLFDQIEWVQADLLDYFSLKDAFEGIEYVYHSAAVVSFQSKDAHKMLDVNVEGTAHIANLCIDFSVKKLCYISSVGALGTYPDNRCTDENALWQKIKTTSTYSISKYYAENEVWRAGEEGLNVVIVNPATIIGFGDWTESSSTIIKKVAEGLSFYPPGRNGFVGVKDVVKAATQLMEGEVSNKRFLLVAENLSFRKLLSKIADELQLKQPKYKVNLVLAKMLMVLDQIRALFTKKKAVLTRETLHTAFKEKCFSSDRIKNELGFEFQPMSEVIEESCRLYREKYQL
ncbi:MAG: NAD-dependent epimerase/dehydratase family protein [Vicingaceae bacterium]